MRIFELRVYTLNSKDSLNFYMNHIYPRHLSSFPVFGIEAHGFWTKKDDAEPRLFVLASYPADVDPDEVAQRYMQSKEFSEDVRDFDISNIVHVDSTFLLPSADSPPFP